MHLLRAVLALAAVAGTSGLAGCAPSTGAEAGTASRPSEVVTSGPPTGDQLLHGRVLTDGAPLAGARVWVEVQPDQATMQGLADGEVVDTFTVAAVTTDARGRYVVRLDPDDLPGGYLQEGFVNHEVWFWHDGRATTWSTTAHLLPDGSWRSRGEDLPADPTTAVTVDLARGRVVSVESGGGRTSGEPGTFGVPTDAVPDRTG